MAHSPWRAPGAIIMRLEYKAHVWFVLTKQAMVSRNGLVGGGGDHAMRVFVCVCGRKTITF